MDYCIGSVNMLNDDQINQIVNLVVAKLTGHIDDQILTSIEVAKLLGVSVPTVERKTKSGEIPSFQIGRLRRYSKRDILDQLRAV